MSYASSEELRSRLGASVFTEIYGDGTDYTNDLSDAEAEINGYAALRYSVPLTGSGTLSLVKGWTLTLAEERAYSRSAGSQYAEKVKLRVDQVRKMLDLLRTGEFAFPDAAKKEVSSSGASAAFASTRAPVFGRDNMKGF